MRNLADTHNDSAPTVDTSSSEISSGCEQHGATNSEALALAKTLTINAAEYCAWIGPLLEALSASPQSGARFATNWGGSPFGNEPTPDRAKHEAYVAHIRDTIDSVWPWLMPLLDAAGATVVVSPGVFCYVVTTRLGYAFEIPELRPITYLTPWSEPDEARH